MQMNELEGMKNITPPPKEPQKAPPTVKGEFTPEPLVLQGYGVVQPRSMTIISYHFMEMKARFMHSARRVFVLPAFSREMKEPTSVVVYDSQQYVEDAAGLATLQPGEMRPPSIPMPVRVETIVQDLETNWCTGYMGVMGRIRPGIGRITGTIATDQEKSRYSKQQESLCVALVQEAHQIHQGKIKNLLITDVHRKALDYLDSEKADWYKPIEKGHTKLSPITGNRIPMEAAFDGGQDILRYYIQYGVDPIVYGDEFMSRMMKDRPEVVEAHKKSLESLGLFILPAKKK